MKISQSIKKPQPPKKVHITLKNLDPFEQSLGKSHPLEKPQLLPRPPPPGKNNNTMNKSQPLEIKSRFKKKSLMSL